MFAHLLTLFSIFFLTVASAFGDSHVTSPLKKCPENTTMKSGYCVSSGHACYSIMHRNGPASSHAIYSQSKPYLEGQCQLCGFDNPSDALYGCCKSGQIAHKTDDGKVYCVDQGSKKCLTSITSVSSSQSIYTGGECGSCGFSGSCCLTGQKRDVTTAGQHYCIDPTSGKCKTEMDTNGQQQDFSSCSSCGYYPETKCPRVCPASQKLINLGQKVFCVDDDSLCKTTIAKGQSSTDQTDYKQGDCGICGKYPLSECDGCESNQKMIKGEDGQRFCVENGVCKTLISYDSQGTKNQQTNYEQGECSQCGQYPADNCSLCKPDQTPMSSGQGTYCVDKTTNKCFTNLQNQKKQSEYNGPGCAPCGSVYCCADNEDIVITQGYQFCVNQTSGKCQTPIVNNQQKPFTDGPCAACGLYQKVKQCPYTCLTGQKLYKTGEFCISNSDGKCYTPIGGPRGLTSQSSYTQGPASTCGIYPPSKCPAECKTGQQAVNIDGKLTYCVDSSDQCLSPVRYDINGNPLPQTSYKQGDCAPCGKTKCCGKNQTLVTKAGATYCVDSLKSSNTYGKCFGLKKGSSPQSAWNQSPCNTCGLDQSFQPCPVKCPSGQILSSSKTFCYSNRDHKCHTVIGGPKGLLQQSDYKEGDCQQCGLYPENFCPADCATGQVPVSKNGKVIYCKTSENKCLTPIIYSKDGTPSQQLSYKQGECSPCGSSECCADNQTLTHVNGQAFCVDNKKQCFSLVKNGEQTPWSKSPCDVCGVYPSSDCDFECPGSQKISESGKYCVSPLGDCWTPLGGPQGLKHQTPYIEKNGACGTCANLNGCCRIGQYQPANTQDLCVNRANLSCYTTTNPSGQQDQVLTGDCGPCGKWDSQVPNAACCASNQEVKQLNGKVYCVEKSTQQCYTQFNSNHSQSPIQADITDPQKPCFLCGKENSSNCASFCDSSTQQRFTATDGTVFCVDKNSHDCFTSYGGRKGLTKQTAYKGGACTMCGKYPDTQCPAECKDNAFMVKGSGGTKTYCVLKGPRNSYIGGQCVKTKNKGSTPFYASKCCSSGYFSSQCKDSLTQ